MSDDDSPRLINALESLNTNMTDFMTQVLRGGATKATIGEDGSARLNGIDKDLKDTIVQLNHNIEENTKHIGLLASAISGGRLNQVSRNINAPIPGPNDSGHSSFRLGYDPFDETPGSHLRYGNIPGAARTFFLNAMQEREIKNAAGNVVYGRTPLGTALRTGQAVFNNLTSAVPAVRGEWNRINAQMQQDVDLYVTGPTQLGNLAGYAGPGMESVSSSAGSYLASRFAAPSMFLSGGMNPNLIGGMFGAEMSRATTKGYESKYRAFTRSLNPFDMLSYDQALNINKAVAGKMFTSETQQIGVEEAITDLVNTIGYDAIGPAIDTFDLAVKRLHADIGETNNLMKDMGEFAKAAGKSTNQFISEMNQTTSQLTQQGANGPNTQYGAMAYSSFPNVSGPAMASYLNGPQMGGLYAAMIASNPNSPYNNPKDMFNLALVGPQGLAGGKNPDQVAAMEIQSVNQMVKMFQGYGYDKNTAMNMVAVSTGTDVQKIRDLVEKGPGIVKQTKALAGIRDITKGANAAFSSDQFRKEYARQNPAARDALSSLLKQGPTGHGRSAMSTLTAGFLGRKDPFESFDLGFSKDPQFEEHVHEMWVALSDHDMGKVNELRKEDWGEEAYKAALQVQQMASKDPKKVQSAFENLSRYGLRITGRDDAFGRMPSYNSTNAANTASVKKYRQAMGGYVHDLVTAGTLTKGQEKEILDQLNKPGVKPTDVETKIKDMIAQKRIKDQGNYVTLKLDGDAAKYFKMFSAPAGSSQNGELVINSPSAALAAYNNRNG